MRCALTARVFDLIEQFNDSSALDSIDWKVAELGIDQTFEQTALPLSAAQRFAFTLKVVFRDRTEGVPIGGVTILARTMRTTLS